jgi:HK97 family phage major capsid protein
MSNRLKELREKRGKTVKEMRDLIETAETENRDLTAEELERHGQHFALVEQLRGQIEALERSQEAERVAAAREIDTGDETAKKDPGSVEERVMGCYRRYLRTGRIEGEGAEEFRALQADVDTEGGFLRAPQQFVEQLLKNVDDATFIRQRATKFSITTAESLGVPTLDTDLDDADWTAELATGNEDTAMRIGKRELRPHPLAKRIKVSKKLVRASALPIEQIIMQRMGYKFGITGEKAYLTGTGANQPLGVFTAHADGISTGRDVSSGNTMTEIRFDGLIAAKYSVKAQYWPRADWLFHRNAVEQIVKLKDGEGQYIWRMSVRDGEPDMLLGRPLMIIEYAPNTFTTGLYVGLFGDFSKYWIVDALDMQVQRLVELYAETNQDGFIGRLESDGAPVLQEAFARVKLA